MVNPYCLHNLLWSLANSRNDGGNIENLNSGIHHYAPLYRAANSEM